MNCPDCGTTIDLAATSCPTCAADLTTPAAENEHDADPAPTPDPVMADEVVMAETPSREGSFSEPPTMAGPSVPPPPRGVVPAPQPIVHPSGLSSDARMWGMAAHLSALFFGFVGPLVVWLVKREEHPFLDHHGREALNFNLSITLYTIVGVVLGFVTLLVGFIVIIPVLIAMGIFAFVVTIIAAVKANNGEGYRYPLTIRFVQG